MPFTSTPLAHESRPLLKLERVSKRHPNGTVALHDLSLDVGDHDFIGLLGPPGCGKSTLLRLLAGLAPATSGKLTWYPQRTLGASRTDRERSFVFQQPALMAWSTVFDNVYLPLRLSGVQRDQADTTVSEALAMLGLTRLRSAYPSGLALDVQMRVSIARALVSQPRLLLMDEPFAALHEMARTKLTDDLLAIWKEHRFTIVFTAHSVREAVQLCNRIVVMAPSPVSVSVPVSGQGRAMQELAINEPYPRQAAEFPFSRRFNEHVQAAQRALRTVQGGIAAAEH